MSDIGSPVAFNIPRSVTRKPNPTTGKPPIRPNAALTKRIRTAIDAQIFDGLRRKEAAERAKISESALYQALRKPAVLAYWNAQLEVLRTGERARNLHRLAEIRDQDVNLAASVRAVQVLEQTQDGQRGGVTVNVAIAAGYVIDLSHDYEGQRSAQPSPSGAKPLIDNDDVGR